MGAGDVCAPVRGHGEVRRAVPDEGRGAVAEWEAVVKSRGAILLRCHVDGNLITHLKISFAVRFGASSVEAL